MPKRKVPKDARERILEAAMAEFARVGFNGARLARIAKAAKVSSQLLYHYFPSKLGLHKAILEASLSQVPFPTTLAVEFEAMELWFHNTRSWYGDIQLRLVLWEALENRGGHYAAEASRRDAMNAGIETFRLAQENGDLPGAFDPFFLYMTFAGLNALPKIFPQMPRLLGIDPEEPQFLDRWHKHLILVAGAMRHTDAELRNGDNAKPVRPLEIPADRGLHQEKRAFTLEEAREVFDQLIARVAESELGEARKHVDL